MSRLQLLLPESCWPPVQLQEVMLSQLKSLHECNRVRQELIKGCDSFRIVSQGKVMKNVGESGENIK